METKTISPNFTPLVSGGEDGLSPTTYAFGYLFMDK